MVTPSRPTSARSLRVAAIATAALVTAAALAGCSQSAPAQSDSTPDNGTALTMWARDSNGNVAQTLVKEYNKSHKNQVKLTIIPSNSYQAKVGAAAGSNGLPDILAADVVYSPNYVKQGLYQDITSELKSLPFYNQLSHAHTEAASKDGKLYGTPLIVDSSLIMYNKDLFAKAGLDPQQGPKNFTDIYNDAKAIRDKVGGDTYGFYFAGDCAGCNAYTMMPYLAAAGKPPFIDDGKKAQIDTAPMKDTLELYKKMFDEGIVPASAKSDDGTNWTKLFNAGKIGILPIGNFNFAPAEQAKITYGEAGLPAPDGSKTAGFIGGDVAGISKNSTHKAQAWNFLQWTLGEDAQVNVLAKAGLLPSRVDLADNKYSSKNPAVVAAIKGEATGYTPSSIAYGSLVNDATGPWLKAIRDYVFNGHADALTTAQKSFDSGLAQAY
ncbi:sugar ABC transporter substrate-binding protein [uncultured Leifsonia sp.]|jgi:multiple sugar transport system substrate-binding protein|uniref:ABC transporter substrate-binding protein n=1 Tax=uncultured Leifsonia sp. TaxID=340359 RepID=UPI0025CEEC5D|nr:sugar ABC transporter substrate-binding protein [uncultured Leifsonia sp.]